MSKKTEQEKQAKLLATSKKQCYWYEPWCIWSRASAQRKVDKQGIVDDKEEEA